MSLFQSTPPRGGGLRVSKMADTHNLCRSLWDRYPFLSQYFDFNTETHKLIPKYKHPKGLRKTHYQGSRQNSEFKVR